MNTAVGRVRPTSSSEPPRLRASAPPRVLARVSVPSVRAPPHEHERGRARVRKGG